MYSKLNYDHLLDDNTLSVFNITRELSSNPLNATNGILTFKNNGWFKYA